tara:strand:- start:1474 stop:2307 length:834 start_codon:yes stop_codon:yes gene_type:complete
MKFRILILITFLILCSCSNKENQNIEVIKESSQDLQMIEAYNQGLEALNMGDGIKAANKFNDAELLFPQSVWAYRAALMSAYSYYVSMYYDDAIYEIENFLKKYKNNEREDYAYYLLALSHYEKISDEKKDLEPLLESKKYFELIISKFPDTDFAIDSSYKLELINEILASKEMYIANHYMQREKWIPALNRYKFVLKNYDRSVYVEEALHRLVEIHYKIGLVEESKKYASILGYNYQSSKWYEKSYKIFNKEYKKPTIKKNKKKSLIVEKIKQLLD